jgi:hypothetical protein
VAGSPPQIAAAAIEEAQILRQDLARIGLKVVIKEFPLDILFQKLATPGEPFDLAGVGFDNVPDPGLLDCLFNGKWIHRPEHQDGCDWSYFNSRRYNRRLSAASRLTGAARSRAFGKLDVELTRDAAPGIAYEYDNTLTLVSTRTGCVVLNPYLDLDAVCLRS